MSTVGVHQVISVLSYLSPVNCLLMCVDSSVDKGKEKKGMGTGTIDLPSLSLAVRGTRWERKPILRSIDGERVHAERILLRSSVRSFVRPFVRSRLFQIQIESISFGFGVSFLHVMTSAFNRRRYDSSLERQARLAAALAVASAANRSRPRSMSLDQRYASRRSEWIFFVPNYEVM